MKNIITEASELYEVNSTLKKVLSAFYVPLLNNAPKWFISVIKRSHPSVRQVVEEATTHSALETLYNVNPDSIKRKNFYERFYLNIWFNLDNAKAVRNRLKIVKREFKKALLEKSRTKDFIHILSIASGSSRAIIEVLTDPEVQELIDQDLVFVTFIDKNPKAIEYSKDLAKYVGNYRFNWVTATAGDFFRFYEFKEDFDIVEMVGLLDYFDDIKAVNIFTNIYSRLKKNGVLITANISNNRERKFITNVVGWRMIYRSAVELINCLVGAGFEGPKIYTYCEPLKIHSVAVAKK
jgi:SAM-dependent methyltransferase